MIILIVEDQLEISALIKQTLDQESCFECYVANNGLMALELVADKQPDLIILDVMLPGLDGLEVCARIRNKLSKKDPFILMLTAKGDEIDRIIGLSTGADDYLVKPFSPRELVARVRALLRRNMRGVERSQIFKTDHFKVDIDQRLAHRLTSANSWDELDLTTLEFNLLSTFLSYPNRVWSRTQLIDKLWGSDFYGDERVVDTHVARLRKKIESDSARPTFIKTITGVGYKFEDTLST